MRPRTDALTPQLLQTSRRNWWDDLFTRLLLDAIPLDTRSLVEINCGLAAAAHTLLPSLPAARYLGLDPSPELLAEARVELLKSSIAPRAELRLAAPTTLPVDAQTVDVVLSLMSLQHIAELDEVLREGQRVLVPGGRLVAVEPDNLGQQFYFDGVLEEVNQTIHALCLKARVARQPADIAIGPRLPSLLRDAGYEQIRFLGHVVHSTRMEPASDYFSRLARVASRIAGEGGLPVDEPAVTACHNAIRRCQFAGIPKRIGFSAHLVPVFLAVGVTHKPV